jgi:hypothetical protein
MYQIVEYREPRLKLEHGVRSVGAGLEAPAILGYASLGFSEIGG